MRICFFGTYERDFVSNLTLIDGLRRQGWDVWECHVPIWEKQRNKTGKYLRGLSLVLRGTEIVVAYFRLMFKYLFVVPAYDIMIVGYIGHMDIPLAWLLTRFPRRPLVFSPLISLYDTLVFDRKAFSEPSLMGRFLKQLDRWACRMSDLVLLDTEAHIRYFVDTFDLPREKFVRVFVGSYGLEPVSRPPTGEDGPFRVGFLGKFTPLHGLEVMLQTAALLRDETGIEFHFVGSGQLSDEIHASARRLDLPNVRFQDWIGYEKIPVFMADMDVCLGIFGVSAKAARVIPGKVFLSLSLGKPVITADTPAIHELLTDGESVLLCEAGSPEALRDAVLRARGDRERLNHIGRRGYEVYRQQASGERIGNILTERLSSLFAVSKQGRMP
ncbi:MAG: glycosyltransferase family 4 protein [candidate division Zixibacteria bacterium]|nr:glycosyltransferase family 4 protein [candidate division Zixibacteria bacterium]